MLTWDVDASNMGPTWYSCIPSLSTPPSRPASWLTFRICDAKLAALQQWYLMSTVPTPREIFQALSVPIILPTGSPPGEGDCRFTLTCPLLPGECSGYYGEDGRGVPSIEIPSISRTGHSYDAAEIVEGLAQDSCGRRP